MMETAFYEDPHHQQHQFYPSSVSTTSSIIMNMNSMNNNNASSAAKDREREQLKRKMTLDLQSAQQNHSGPNSNKTSVIKKAKYFPSGAGTPNASNSLQTPIFHSITGRGPELLSSPDLHKLGLASPELDRYILDRLDPAQLQLHIQSQQAQSQLATPTPGTVTAQAQVFFPKNVTEEQEDYAKGFSDALAQLQSQNQLSGDSTSAQFAIMGGNPNIMLSQVHQLSHNHNNHGQSGQQGGQQSQTLQTFPLHIFSNSNTASSSLANSEDDDDEDDADLGSGASGDDLGSENSMTSSSTSTYTTNGQMAAGYGRPPAYNSHMHGQGHGQGQGHAQNFGHGHASSGGGVIIKEEPQTVPQGGGAGSGSSAPVSPINMANQEKIKLERKRQRNRVAASKCRKRKLERISKLEDKVKQIKAENSELVGVSTRLREAVAELKQEVMKHVQLGCQIMISGNLSNGNGGF